MDRLEYARLKAMNYSKFVESQHPRDDSGQFSSAAFGETIPEDEASELVGKIRDGIESSKNGGRKSSREKTGPLVMSKVPVSMFKELSDRDYGTYADFLKASTDPERVKTYEENLPSTPIYVTLNRKKNIVLSDGGHRLVAAINRGDEYINALVPPELHEKIHGASK